jgi:predicted lipoprotein with Yx(FWY)xxD motif
MLMQRWIAPLALVVAALIALAACGSSSKTAVESGTPTSVANGTTTTVKGDAPATPVVQAATTAKLGAVLVDADGMTVYTLTNNGTAVACTGQCAIAWPPLLVANGTTTVAAATGVTGLGTAAGEAGTQVTSDKLPLYRFSGDAAPGDTNGDGIANFGGVWHVVKAPASAVVAPAPTAPPVTDPPATSPPPTTSSYGY